MDKKLILMKLNNLERIYDEFKKQYNFYLKQENKGFIKRTALLAVQKKLEELIEYSIKLNKLLLNNYNKFPLSYQESFLMLKDFDFNEEVIDNFSELAIFRNKLAHEYLIITDIDTINYSKIILKYFDKYFKRLKSVFNEL